MRHVVKRSKHDQDLIDQLQARIEYGHQFEQHFARRAHDADNQAAGWAWFAFIACAVVALLLLAVVGGVL